MRSVLQGPSIENDTSLQAWVWLPASPEGKKVRLSSAIGAKSLRKGTFLDHKKHEQSLNLRIEHEHFHCGWARALEPLNTAATDERLRKTDKELVRGHQSLYPTVALWGCQNVGPHTTARGSFDYIKSLKKTLEHGGRASRPSRAFIPRQYLDKRWYP